jgi:glycosyltransferase involved in cell wall biosynthesis
MNFHRQALRALSSDCEIYMVHDEVAKNSEIVGGQGWEQFVVAIVDIEQAASIVEKGGPGRMVEISAHQFQPRVLQLPRVSFVFDLHPFDVGWKYSAASMRLLRSAVLESDAAITMFPRTYYDLEALLATTKPSWFLVQSPLLVKPTRGREDRALDSIEEVTLLYPAQFQIHKNHVGLLNGLRCALERGERYKLLFTGSDLASDLLPYREQLDQMIRDAGLQEHAQVLGHLNEQELVTLYRSCHGMVIGSVAEGGAYVALEGIYAGLPVALNELRAARLHLEMYGGHVHYFDSTDPDSTADAFAWISTVDRAWLAIHNDPCRAAIDLVTWEDTAKSIYAILSWVCGQRDRPVPALAPGAPVIAYR